MFRYENLGKTIFVCILGLGVSHGNATAQVSKTRLLTVAAEYSGWSLEDVSSDGRLALLYQASRSMDVYSVPLSTRRTVGSRAAVDRLRVIRIRDGHEISSIQTGFYPMGSRFMAFSNRVHYAESPTNSKDEFTESFWDPESGKVTVCNRGKFGTDGSSVKRVVFADEKRGVAVARGAVGHLLFTIEPRTCHVSQLGSFGTSPDAMLSGEEDSVAISPNGGQIAFGIRGGGVVIRAASDISILKEIQREPDLFIEERPMYTPDGKYLILFARSTVIVRPKTRRFLQFYDTSNHMLSRQMDITDRNARYSGKQLTTSHMFAGSAAAISTDGKTIAIAHTAITGTAPNVAEQAEIVLYDLESGNEVARAQHKPHKRVRNDPFAARVRRLVFTGDGDYLLSGTGDTVVWKL